jgi:hypothetical protein
MNSDEYASRVWAALSLRGKAVHYKYRLRVARQQFDPRTLLLETT